MINHDHENKYPKKNNLGTKSFAKLSMPRAAKGVARPRLFSLIDKARQAAAIWIVAPGGSGKTTLAASYIRDRKLPYLWYQMDKDDADPATFFYYLGLAVKQIIPGDEVSLPLLTPEYHHDVSGFARRYFRQLFTVLPRDCIVVLDNYQDISAVETMNEVLRNVVGEVPKGGNILVISRTPPPSELARLQVTGGLEAFGWDELRFRFDETKAIVCQQRSDLDSNVIRALHERSEGWVAGLTLLLKQFKKNGAEVQSSRLGSLEEIFDFFATEVFDELPQSTRTFLMQTALLSHITPSLAAEVSGNGEASNILTDFHKQHFFTSQRDLSEPTYQYHALFKEFLMAKAVESYSHEQYIELTHRVGNLLEKYGRDEEAVGLYLQSRLWSAAIPLIFKLSPQLLAQARAQIVATWIQSLPEDIVSVTPWLLFWRGVSRQFVNPFEARSTLEQAFAGFSDARDVMGQLSAASAIIDIVFFLRESLLSTTRWVEVLQNHVNQNFIFPSTLIEARILSSLFSVLMYMRPQDSQLSRYAERLVVLLDDDLEINQKVLIGAHLINYYSHLAGDLNTCERIVMRITPQLASSQVTVVTQILWRSFCTLPCILRGQDDDAYEMVRPLMTLVKDNNLPFMEPIAIFYIVFVHLCRGDIRAAEPLLGRMAEVVNTAQPADVAWLYLANCWYALSCGEYSTAFNQGQAALQAISRVGATLTWIDVNCLVALERCQSGKYDDALSILAMLREQAFGNSPRLRHQALMVEVYVHLQIGDHATCHDCLREAFAIGNSYHYFGSLYCLFPKKVMTLICAEALRAGIEVDYTQRLILRRCLQPDDLYLENWPWPVSIYTLGQFRLIIHGKDHPYELNTHLKPLKLLKVLIALGGQNVQEAKISEILWPDAEGDAAHSSFTTTLSRLRKLIGDEAILVNSGRLTINRRFCWLDSWSFEEQYNQLKKKDVPPATRQDIINNIVALYRGPLLIDEEGVWIERLRQRLQAIFNRVSSPYGNALSAASEGIEYH